MRYLTTILEIWFPTLNDIMKINKSRKNVNNAPLDFILFFSNTLFELTNMNVAEVDSSLNQNPENIIEYAN